MEVFDKPDLLAQREKEALTAIKKHAPLTYGDDRKIISRLEALIAEKASQETTHVVTEAMTEPSIIPSLLRPPQLPPAGVSPTSLAALASFAQMLQPPPPDEDEFVGRTINTSRVRMRGVINEETENE